MLWAVIIGFLSGLAARHLMPGNHNMGWVMTILLGIVGSVVGTLIGRVLGIYGPGEAGGFIASIIGAMLILAAYNYLNK